MRPKIIGDREWLVKKKTKKNQPVTLQRRSEVRAQRGNRKESRDEGCRWVSGGWGWGGDSHILSAQWQLVA